MKIFQSIRFKISFLASLSFVSVAILILVYSGVKLKKQAFEGAVNKIQFIAKKQSATVKQYLEGVMSSNRMLAQIFADYENIDCAKETAVFEQILKNTLIKNDELSSVWTVWTPMDTNDNENNLAVYFYRNKGFIDSYDLRDNLNTHEEKYYNLTKKILKESITDLYYGSLLGQDYGETMLVSTVEPIIVNDNFKGVVSFDIGLDRFGTMLDTVKYFDTGYSMLVTNSGNIIAHPQKDMVGVNLFDKNSRAVEKHNIRERVSKGEMFNIYEKNEFTGELEFIQVTPFFIGGASTPWSLITIVPVKEINKFAKTVIEITVLIGFIGLLVIMIIGWFVIGKITKPIQVISTSIRDLDYVNLDKLKSFANKLNNDIGDMANSTYVLIDWLKRTRNFVKEVANKNYKIDYEPLNKDDELGKSLIEIRDYLEKSENENKLREIESKQQIWHSEGFGHVSEIIRQNNKSIENMSSATMKYVVDYIDANQGGIYVINDDDENNIYYELIASVAYGREKALDNKIKEGEGLVGRCVFEKEPIVLTEIPQDYVRITSGLGTVNPDSILIVPIILNDIVYGVLEFASFGKMEDYKVSFVRKISDVIASAISNHKVSERTAVLLDRAQSQSEALTLQEEQMRQNIEEMKATQEEQEQLQLKLNLRITEMQMVIDSIPYSIIVVDSHGGLRLFNSAFCNMSHYKKEELDVKKVDVLFGSDISIILQKKQFKGELLIKNGSPIKIIIESSIIDTEKKIFLLKITEA